MLDAFGLPVLDLAGYEADDILATLATQAEAVEADCFLVSGDKDCRQLISDRIKIFNIRKNLVYDEAALDVDWGIPVPNKSSTFRPWWEIPSTTCRASP